LIQADSKVKLHYMNIPFVKNPEIKSFRVILSSIFIWALLIRLIFIIQSFNTPILGGLSLDSDMYDKFAVTLLEDGITDKTQIYGNSFYSYFLAGIYALFGLNHLPVALIQAFLDSINCLLVFFIAKYCFNRTTGLMAAGIYALYGLVIFYSGIILPPVLTIFLSLSGAACLMKGLDKQDNRFYFAAGISLAATALAQPHFSAVILLVLEWISIRQSKRETFGPALKTVGAFLLGVILILGLMAWRHYASAGVSSPFAVQRGINFYIGNNPDAHGYYRTPEGMAAHPIKIVESSIEKARKITGHDLSPAEASQYWMGQGMTFLKEHPGRAIILYLKKLILFWRAEEIPSSIDFNLSKRFTPLLSLPFINFGSMAPLALIGIYLAWRQHRRAQIPVMFVSGLMLAVILFFVNERYRLPAVPFLIMFAALALTEGWQAFKRRDKNNLIKGTAALFILVLLINRPLALASAAKTSNQGTHYFNLGVTYQKQDDLRAAETAYQQALSLCPDYPDVFNNLGLIYETRGQKNRARQAYRKALTLDPDFPQAQLNLQLLDQ